MTKEPNFISDVIYVKETIEKINKTRLIFFWNIVLHIRIKIFLLFEKGLKIKIIIIIIKLNLNNNIYENCKFN